MTYKDYITVVFIIVDEVLKLMGHKHKTNKPKFSGSERIETTFSRLKHMGIENIKAVSLEGFLTKIYFFILALQFKIILNV